jgi:hypothetical protein
MSDGEAFILKLIAVASFICLIVLLFVKLPKNDNTQYPERIIDTVTVRDTVYKTDTVTLWKPSKTDTVYITKKDTSSIW